MNEEISNITAAILTIPAVSADNRDPDTIIAVFQAIRKRLENKGNETFTVPQALEPLAQWALREKARREQELYR